METKPVTVAQELLAAIHTAKIKEQSVEVVTDYPKARKFLTTLGYTLTPFKEGIVISFPKAKVYVHGEKTL